MAEGDVKKDRFAAMIVSESGAGGYERRIGERSVGDLPPGDVLIRVRYSSLNFKDALSASGNRGVTKSYPHTPGIDAAGVVEESAQGAFRPGDEVIVTGFDLGMNTPGGFGRYIRVPAAWVVPRPDTLTLKEAMIFGTAGFTAALSVRKLVRHPVARDGGRVLVTGATGGVGSLALAILAKAGYRVTAATGKESEGAFLASLGAADVVSREEVSDETGKALLKERWDGVVDTVGGKVLSTAIRSARYGAAVTCCGNVGSPDLPVTVYPFILRGVTLYGIDSANCPMEIRREVWETLAGEWKPEGLASIARECGLGDLGEEIDRILRGGQRGRVVVDLSGEGSGGRGGE